MELKIRFNEEEAAWLETQARRYGETVQNMVKISLKNYIGLNNAVEMVNQDMRKYGALALPHGEEMMHFQDLRPLMVLLMSAEARTSATLERVLDRLESKSKD